MARVAWTFNGWAFPINPEQDSFWSTELVLAERVPINSPRSRFQYGGMKADTRQIEGWIWGPESDEMLATFRSWQKNRTQGHLVDHMGFDRLCFVTEFKATPERDIKEWVQGRQTYRYQMTFRALD